MLNIVNVPTDTEKAAKVHTFLNTTRPKYILGRNIRASAVAAHVAIDGFIDDFAQEATFMGKPVLKTADVPLQAIVLITSICNPFSAQAAIAARNIEYIDYFSFFKYAGLSLPENEFQPDFTSEFNANREKYDRVYELLSDDVSRNQYETIINFRLNHDLTFLEGFTNREKEQYFEDFLNLQPAGEVFVDAGGFDGYTSTEFIKRCPQYGAIHLFEPQQDNLEIARRNLQAHPNVHVYPTGLYSEKASFNFEAGGSASRITQDGTHTIHVEALDRLIQSPVTFIKMDIEGAELEAIKGAQHTIRQYKPKLAISAYHKKDDFWKIPELVLSIHNNYKVYFRHYMEGVTETVMFFI